MITAIGKNLRDCLRCDRKSCADHRCVCAIDGVACIEHAQGGDCPLGRYQAGPAPKRAANQVVSLSSLWRQLHARAAAYPANPSPLQIALERRWLRAFGRLIPCGDCRQKWSHMDRQSPIGLTSRDTYFAATVDRHNRVNVDDLHRPEWPLALAAAEYGITIEGKIEIQGKIEAASQPL